MIARGKHSSLFRLNAINHQKKMPNPERHQISDFNTGFYYAGGVVVPNQGWFLYGGKANPSTTSHQLTFPDSTWC